MNRREDGKTPPRPNLAFLCAGIEEDEAIFALVLAISPPADPPPASGRADEHELVRGLLADASQRQLSALRHLLTCPLCRQLARVVLLEIPALELAGSGDRLRRHRLNQRS